MARMRSIDKLTLREMMLNFELYVGLPDGLTQLPVPDYIKICGKEISVPTTLNEFCDNLCYGQRLFFNREEDNDFGLIVRAIDGYFYPLATKKKWDEESALLFGKNVLTLHVKDLYPVAMQIMEFVSEMVEKEQKLLHRDPSKMELAAGVEKLNVFSELTSLDFLRDAMKITIPEVLLQPYNECLVRFMMAKEQSDFQERYFELMREESKPKAKYHAKT
jgi:hypothetical protein